MLYARLQACCEFAYRYSSSYRCLCLSTGRNHYCPPGGTSGTTCWERGAEKIKNTKISNPYLDAMRQTHDPIQHVKTIEDELKGTISRALGKQGEKILRAVHFMEEHWREYQRLLQQQEEDLGDSCSRTSTTTVTGTSTKKKKKKEDLLNDVVGRYNQYREQALTARWELTVHRQAAGLIVGNHQYVVQAYPIAEKLPDRHPPQPHPLADTTIIANNTEKNDSTATSTNTNSNTTIQPPKKKFTDPLEWWQTVGRWR